MKGGNAEADKGRRAKKGKSTAGQMFKAARYQLVRVCVCVGRNLGDLLVSKNRSWKKKQL